MNSEPLLIAHGIVSWAIAHWEEYRKKNLCDDIHMAVRHKMPIHGHSYVDSLSQASYDITISGFNKSEVCNIAGLLDITIHELFDRPTCVTLRAIARYCNANGDIIEMVVVAKAPHDKINIMMIQVSAATVDYIIN